MSFSVLDLNDINLRVVKDKQRLLDSPGYAVIKDNQIAFGTTAEKLKRIHPRNTHDDYWYRLSQDPIQSASSQIRHNADLAFMHLSEIFEHTGKNADWLIAVPANFSQEQLALFLGLLKAEDIKNVILVDSALLTTSNSMLQGDYRYLDIQLHQIIISRLNSNDSKRVISSETFTGIGILKIYDQCAKIMSDEFINQSRFDPHHNAETEQLLYETIPECLKQLNTAAVTTVNIKYHNKVHQAIIKRELVMALFRRLFEVVLQKIDASMPVILNHRLHSLPGISEMIENAILLDEDSLFDAALKYTDFLQATDASANYINTLPVLAGDSIEKPNALSVKQKNNITHVLINNCALKLNAAKCYFDGNHELNENLTDNTCYSIHHSDDQYFLQTENSRTIFLNENAVAEKSLLALGDTISTDLTKPLATFIRVK
ncbi:MAG: hypothetical protein O7D86_04705 [Proteobacteria bacterium]|nr:hypothetical protein [Pseudomonadota bacterium]